MRTVSEVPWMPLLLGALLAGAPLTAGCAEPPQRTLAGAGNLTIAMYEERRQADPPSDAAPAAPDRFAALPKRGEAPGASDAGVSGDAGPKAPAEPPAPAAEGPAPGPFPRKAPARLAGFIDPLTKTGDRVPVTLEACLRRALANNLGIQIARFGPAMAQTSVVESEAIFDPSWFMNNALGRVRRDAPTFLLGAATFVQKQWQFATGVDTLLPTGGTIGLAQDWTFTDSNSQFTTPNPQYESGLGVTVRQPLLRGLGLEVTKSPIVLARLDHRISLAEFRVRLMETLLGVEQAYWDLVVAETRVQAISEALEAARENQRIARRRVEEGKDKRIVLSLAESAVTSRQADLVAARLNVARTSDELKRLLNDPELPLEEPTVLEAMELPITDPIPVGREMLQAAMVSAMKNRPEIQQAEARLSQAGVREAVARNQRLPQLDLAASYFVNGLEPDVDRAVREEIQTEYFDWSVGLELRVPIGNRSRVAAHERTRLQQEVALREREDTRQRVLLEISEATRNLAAAEEAILATRAARVAAEQTLKDQQANVAAGAALVKDLLDSQRDLADAKVREMDSMAGYMVSLAALERAKGTLLEFNNIRVLEEDDQGPAAGEP